MGELNRCGDSLGAVNWRFARTRNGAARRSRNPAYVGRESIRAGRRDTKTLRLVLESKLAAKGARPRISSPLSRIFWTTCLDSFLIPNNRWLKFMFRRRRMRRGLFGDTPEAPRVSPKPYARSRTTRPPTVYRPASAIPRDVRGKRNPARRPSAGCLLCNPRVASAARTRPAAGASEANAAAADKEPICHCPV